MSLLLTCDCGARFELDVITGSREISCPACGQTQKPSVRGVKPPLDWFALVSIVCAVVGAFTLVGSLAAVGIGGVSLIRIKRNPEAWSGREHAIAGIVLGLVFSALTLFFLSIAGSLPLGTWVRTRQFTGQIDSRSVAELSTIDGVLLFPKLSPDWKLMRRGTGGDPAIDDWQQKGEMTLFRPGEREYLDVYRDRDHDQFALGAYLQVILEDLRTTRKPLLGIEEDNRNDPGRNFKWKAIKDRPLDTVDGYVGYEWILDLSRSGHTWRFLIQTRRKPDTEHQRPSPIYVLRAYCLSSRFQAAEPEMRKVLEGVRFAR